MVNRVIALLLVLCFGFSVAAECCVISGDLDDMTYGSHETHKSHDHDGEDHAHDQTSDCGDHSANDNCSSHCATCLHTAMTPQGQVSHSITTATFSYPDRAISLPGSEPSSIDHPPCWTV